MNNEKPCCNKKILHKDGSMQIFTPYPNKDDYIKHSQLEAYLDKYKHIMELCRTIVATLILILQVVIFWKIF